MPWVMFACGFAGGIFATVAVFCFVMAIRALRLG